MQCVAIIVLLVFFYATPVKAADGNVVQFVVYAERQADISKVFPGAQIDTSWNNLFLVTIWTNDPERLIEDIQGQLKTNASTLQTIVPPMTMTSATRKWIEYNLVWVAVLVLIFLAGCACGGVIIVKCNSIKHSTANPYKRCHTTP
jgi:hypothetical protein